jgi:hypothetical protein
MRRPRGSVEPSVSNDDSYEDSDRGVTDDTESLADRESSHEDL